MRINTPVLLITWRRPDTLRQLIDAIRIVAPSRLFVASDGPHHDRPCEVQKVAATRALIEEGINWPCQIHRLYSDTNQGCRQGPIKAITWFFEHVEEGIILEDDCIPDTTFFDYCEWALHMYREDKRVMHISGNNFSAPSTLFDDEVSFTSLPQVWGWATWSDSWHLFQQNPFYLEREMRPQSWALSRIARLSKIKHLEALKNGLDAWDYQWQITVLNRNGLSICPRINLISNIGVGFDASHTINDCSRTFLKTGGFLLPSYKPIPENNIPLTRFLERKMGLAFSPLLLVWLYKFYSQKINKFSKSLLRFIFLGRFVPIVIASTGRVASTMLVHAVSHSFVESKFSFFPSWMRKHIKDLPITRADRLKDIHSFICSPVIKTHDLFSDKLRIRYKYIFLYGDPLESAMSARRQGEIRGSAWLDEHIFNLCGDGCPDQILSSDILNYEGQLNSWLNSNAFFVHYSEIWSRRIELSNYLGFDLLLPEQRERTKNELIISDLINNELFDRLKNLEKRFMDDVSN